MFRPFRIGDWIEAQGISGTVDSIQIFHTVLRTGDNKTVILPNGSLSNGIITNTNRQPTRKVVFDVGVDYEADLQKALSPADPDAVVLACRMGLFRSADKGKSWQDMEMKRYSPITYGRDIRVAPQDPKTMYCALSVAAASKDGSVYRSQDAGKTWKRFDKVQAHGTIMSIGLHATDPLQVYIGARYQGEVFGTQDGGETWTVMPLPSPVKDIYSVACG